MKTSWKATTLVVMILAIWMLSGLLRSDDEPGASQQAETEPEAITVEVATTQSELMSRELSLQGQLDPIRSVAISARTSGVVEQVAVRKGASVTKDELLIKLDDAGRSNSRAEAQAAVKSARGEQAAAASLQRQRLQSEMQLQQADAVLEAALAQLAGVELDIEYTKIGAPFGGIVNNLPVEVGELIERGDVVAQIIDNTAFKASANVSQQGLAQLAIGQKINVKLITGEQLQGSISFIGSVADPLTRSFPVEALLENSASKTIAAGISATLAIPVEEVKATFIKPSYLSLSSNGEIGVKALDDENRVLFLPIELISTSIDGAWVTGIPDNTRLITLGHGFVNTGEIVRSSDAEAS